MQEYEFNREILKLKGCFPNGFSDEKIAVIFDKVKHLTGQEFQRLCDKIICHSKYAPSVSDFVEQGNTLPGRVFEIRNPIGSCGKCDNGVLDVVKIEDNSHYAFLCNCDTGLKRVESWPRWSDRFEYTFKIITPKDYGPGAA